MPPGPLVTATIVLNELDEYEGGGTLIEALAGGGDGGVRKVGRGHVVLHLGEQGIRLDASKGEATKSSRQWAACQGCRGRSSQARAHTDLAGDILTQRSKALRACLHTL